MSSSHVDSSACSKGCGVQVRFGSPFYLLLHMRLLNGRDKPGASRTLMGKHETNIDDLEC